MNRALFWAACLVVLAAVVSVVAAVDPNPNAGLCCTTAAECNGLPCQNGRCFDQNPPAPPAPPAEVCQSTAQCPAGQECVFGECKLKGLAPDNSLRGYACNHKEDCRSVQLECVDGQCSLTADSCPTVHTVGPDSNLWTFFQEIPTGSGDFVPGPAVPPIGIGSAEFTIDSTGREILFTQQYNGLRLDQIYALAVSFYYSSATTTLTFPAMSIQFEIDSDITNGVSPFEGRLVFEPVNMVTPPSLAPNVWTTYNAISSQARWWATRAPVNAVCPQASPCTWQQVLAAFPNIAIHPTSLVPVFLKAGGPIAPATSFVGNADAFTINGDVWNFEPGSGPTAGDCCATVADCGANQDCIGNRCAWTSESFSTPTDPPATNCLKSWDCASGFECRYGSCVAVGSPEDNSQQGRLCQHSWDCQSADLVCVGYPNVQGQCVRRTCPVA